MKYTFNDKPYNPKTEKPWLKENGVAKIYHPDGTFEWEVPYKDGERNGVVKRYYHDGSLMWAQEWYHGVNLSDKKW